MNIQKKQSECLVFSTVQKTPFAKKQIAHMASFVLQKLNVKGSLSVHCIGDTRMHTLNYHYRGKDRTTDVLSFAAEEGEKFSFVGDRELGDIFISVPQIRRQARGLHISEQEEFCRMLVHGILHILGHDHDRPSRAARMFGIQEDLLSIILRNTH